ncbi:MULTISPECIES: sensor domain-containing protein [Rhizobium]|uniref:Diguanylate cyclase (GGDEF)-like protein/PAS domain S-box-containing protein n=1 Tax=Rhizobium esperanzae TaxID=1967781 RepID=A0A7W6XWH9_9HYPH|nr:MULTISPECIES: EAL domain-containing protein [Rhizobium]MBB4440706.1 diguanylate cyclase (GGDEF)-like protein/PAS domain S-box-containing protein [Rhizobium esperanzae]MDH6203495.1 diguanylate cyclase (GGDEF)-like protein/PAS domain S-box-containing protein [Rhizobium leguminosarum]
MSKIIKLSRAELTGPKERRLLRAMVDQVPDYLFVKDLDCRFVIANEAVVRINGFDTPDEVFGKTDFDLHDAASAEKFFEIERSVIKSGDSIIDMEERVVDAVTGKEKWLLTTKVAMSDDEGVVIGLVGISRDITARKKEDSLRDEQAVVVEMIALNSPLEVVLERLVRLIESQLDGIFGSILLLDETGHLTHGAAPSLPQEYSRAIDGIAIGANVGSCGSAAYRRESVIVADIATDPLWNDFRDLAALHGLRSCWSTPILSHQGNVLGTFAMYSASVRCPTEIETRLTRMSTRTAAIAIERRLAEDQISFMAHHDMLTGLPNRSLLIDRLTQAILQTERHNPWVSVVIVDLDNFKLVNDSLGHTAGDALLKEVSKRMLDCVRPTDAVMRLDGDEFVILLTDLPENTDAISATLHKLRTAIGEPLTIKNQAFHITCSIGVSTFPQDGTDAETLIANADAAMYKAKAAGRDGFQFFTGEINFRAHARLALLEGIRKGIARNEFHLLYQPQVDMKTGRIFAVEALLRWTHPSLGLISPIQFIPLAEETGLIVPLGDWVLEEACRQNKEWQDAGLAPITVCVNVSARQFQDLNWPSRVLRTLDETGLPAECLELELTESLVMRDVDQAVKIMKDLQSAGVAFAIDDFGTGYSSLSALKTLPVSRLKLDQSFVRNLAEDEDDRTIAAAVISLGQKLNMKVIAEGVETDEQVTFLRNNNCDEMQGFHFSKPISSEGIESLLQAQEPKTSSGAIEGRQ